MTFELGENMEESKATGSEIEPERERIKSFLYGAITENGLKITSNIHLYHIPALPESILGTEGD